MNILAIIGTEAHTTSSGWSRIKINGRLVSYRDAVSEQWLSKYGDKHASWCECVFTVAPGDKVEWEAGTNSGYRGADHARINRVFVADDNAQKIELAPLGYPATSAKLAGTLRLVEDRIEYAESAHEEAKSKV